MLRKLAYATLVVAGLTAIFLMDDANPTQARADDLEAHLSLLIEGKRRASSPAAEFEFDRAIAAAVVELDALR